MENSPAVAQARYWHLRQLGLFAGIAGAEVLELGGQVETELIEVGRHIYEFGDPADKVYVLKSGRVKISRASDDGKELILYFVSPGEIFGELAITGGECMDNSAVALEDVFFCAIPRALFESFIQRHPEVSLRVVRVIGRRKERAEKRALDLITKDVRTRLAHTLAELSADFGERDRRGVKIDLPLTQSELAQIVGSTRETTSTIFNEFRRAGLVDSEGQTIWVLDRARLEEYSWLRP